MEDESGKVENNDASVQKGHEATCWGCGLHLLLSSFSPVFKCGWCGAITNLNQKSRKPDSALFSMWRRIRDRFFVTVLMSFVLFVICAGLWAVYPVVFSISLACGIFHCILTGVLATCTISSFCLAAFRSPGQSADILWGSYPVVVKSGLENYTFCSYCEKPKCPRTHHCRSCYMCVLDMDHHCPFIGNCVGAANHRSFIAFLFSVVISCTYVVTMAVYAGYHIWPPFVYGGHLGPLIGANSLGAIEVTKEFVAAVASSALLLSARGLLLLYLAMACFSVEIGISVLLWQQLQYIYQGKTYIDHISSRNGGAGERGCQNVLRFFNCPNWAAFRLFLGSSNLGKLQESPNSKLL